LKIIEEGSKKVGVDPQTITTVYVQWQSAVTALTTARSALRASITAGVELHNRLNNQTKPYVQLSESPQFADHAVTALNKLAKQLVTTSERQDAVNTELTTLINALPIEETAGPYDALFRFYGITPPYTSDEPTE
jgi:hypothetical protein